MKRWEFPILLAILGAGAAVRLYGLNWDQGYWLQPDERQIYFVVQELGWPTSLAEALTPGSPLNPRFFAYGSFPLYLLKFVSSLLAQFWPILRNPDNLHLVGRPLAVAFDLGTIYLTYRLAITLGSRKPEQTVWFSDREGFPGQSNRNAYRHTETSSRGLALIAAAFVSFSVLHVQLAHFYTVDPLLVFLVMMALCLAADLSRGAGWRRQLALGITFGLALATKINAALLVVLIFAAFNSRPMIPNAPRLIFRQSQSNTRTSGATWFYTLRQMAPTLAIGGIVFLLTEPYALIDWRAFLEQTMRESQIAWGRLDVPYTRQFAGTLPYLYPMWQTTLWGIGLPLGLVAWAGFGLALIMWLRRGSPAETISFAWAMPYLAITGALYARYLRYMLPLVPILCLFAAWAVADRRRRWFHAIGFGLLGGGAVLYCLTFISIYRAPHSWITASEWIYKTIPGGSVLALEEWDTALPLPLSIDGQPRAIKEYDVRTLHLYDEPDDAAKWGPLAADLAESDYLIIASRRLYGSIPRLPERYPTTTRYYERLFSGELGFQLIAEFTRGPAWLNPRLPPLPSAAPQILRPDESFVVYDHPRALVFRNIEYLSPGELLQRLQ